MTHSGGSWKLFAWSSRSLARPPATWGDTSSTRVLMGMTTAEKIMTI